MDWLTALFVLFAIIIGEFVGFTLFGESLLGIITLFIVAGILTWLWDKFHLKHKNIKAKHPKPIKETQPKIKIRRIL